MVYMSHKEITKSKFNKNDIIYTRFIYTNPPIYTKNPTERTAPRLAKNSGTPAE